MASSSNSNFICSNHNNPDRSWFDYFLLFFFFLVFLNILSFKPTKEKKTYRDTKTHLKSKTYTCSDTVLYRKLCLALRMWLNKAAADVGAAWYYLDVVLNYQLIKAAQKKGGPSTLWWFCISSRVPQWWWIVWLEVRAAKLFKRTWGA